MSLVFERRVLWFFPKGSGVQSGGGPFVNSLSSSPSNVECIFVKAIGNCAGSRSTIYRLVYRRFLKDRLIRMWHFFRFGLVSLTEQARHPSMSAMAVAGRWADVVCRRLPML
jgi:hypothetical protein